MEFIQAKYYTPTPGGRIIDLIVIHDMESAEEPDTAESVAKWFAGPTSPKASAHYCVDSNSVVQCVKDKDVAWHAPGTNHNSIGIEHAGRARQTAEEWADPYSESMLQMSGLLTAELVAKYKLPAQFVNKAGLLAGHRGITTHAEVSQAWRGSDHWDPGPNFPMAHFLDIVQGNMEENHVPENPLVEVNAPVLCTLMHESWPAGSYVIVCTDGGTFSIGGAPFVGSLGGVHLNSPITAATLTPTGKGVMMVSAADSGFFAVGDAQYKGGVKVRR